MSVEENRFVLEARRIENDCLWTATTHYMASTWASRLHNAIGAIPIVFGSLGGWRLLSDASATHQQIVLGGVFSLLAGVFGSLLSYWNLRGVRREHFSAAGSYKVLQNQARRASEIYALAEAEDDFSNRVEKLARQYDQLVTSTPQPLNFAYWLAERRIKKGVFDETAKSDQ